MERTLPPRGIEDSMYPKPQRPAPSIFSDLGPISELFNRFQGNEAGLCGALGGYPRDEPERPTCKRCLAKASK